MIRLNDIYACVQGEGCLAGTPMVLIRLQGCGVGCPWCDTKETWDLKPAMHLPTIDKARTLPIFWTTADEAEIALKAREIGPNIPWALVTGGEPAEQALGPLVDHLHAQGFRVAIETSGDRNGPPGGLARLGLRQP
jgi:7-carboxy-7-deazaguanine synthase